MAEIELKVKGYKCERCGHEWQPRKKQNPITCPKCKSAYWDIPLKKPKPKEESEDLEESSDLNIPKYKLDLGRNY